MDVQEWQPYHPCPCGCEVVAWKLSVKSGHVVGCKCRPCTGRRSRKKGQAAQHRTWKALGGEGPTPLHEESTPEQEIKVRPEVKSGGQVPKSFHAFIATEWFRRAMTQARNGARIGTGVKPSVSIDGRWLIIDLRGVARGMEDAVEPGVGETGPGDDAPGA
jgi:hypothetical protein